MKHLERLTDRQLLETALAELARVTRLPLVFGGYELDGVATVCAIHGNRTTNLQGLRVETGRGLGGRALAEARPRLTAYYERSEQITHDYDQQVTGEGVTSLAAIPVLVGDTVRAVLYAGAHQQTSLNGVLQRPVAEITGAVGHEIRMRDEARRRAAALAESVAPPRELPGRQLEELRESYAELRSIASGIEDPGLKARLTTLEARLARISGTEESPERSRVRLSPREIDVLSYVALGSTNAETGRALGLTEGTVKAYLKSAASKLSASNRHAAVAAARREGLIP